MPIAKWDAYFGGHLQVSRAHTEWSQRLRRYAAWVYVCVTVVRALICDLQPTQVRNGINNYLAGYFPAENMRFRAEELTFCVSRAEGKIIFSFCATLPLKPDAKRVVYLIVQELI